MSDKAKYAEKAKSILEKYGSDQQKVAEAYAELEETLGKQGLELGDLRKKSEESTKTLNDYVNWQRQAKPVIDWYAHNEQTVKQLWDQHLKNPQRTQNGQMQQVNGWNQSLLTPEEQQALIQQATQQVSQSVLQPWTQSFAKQAQDYVNS